MKIVATVRTRNEERNIDRFCESYQWVDKILVADGMSEDDTVFLAEQYKNVEVRLFDEWVSHPLGSWRNPHGQHINFLIDWAEELEADWMIFDDCDCTPNQNVSSEDWKELFYLAEMNQCNSIFVTRLYLWGEDKHFPNLAKEPSLWAWKLDSGLRAKTDDPWKTEWSNFPKEHEQFWAMPTFALLHRPWLDEEEVQRKLDFYRHGNIPGMEHPIKFGGPLEDLPVWVQI